MTVGEQEYIFILSLIQELPAGVKLGTFVNKVSEGVVARDYVLTHAERRLQISFANDPADVCTTAIRGKEALDQMKKWLTDS